MTPAKKGWALTQPSPKSNKALSGSIAALTLVLLVLMDTISPPGPPLSQISGIVVYSLKSAIGVAITFMGIWGLITARMPLYVRALIAVYLMIILTWFVVWLFGSTSSDAITYLLNPLFSIWSWLTILLIPLVARYNQKLGFLDHLSGIPIWLATAYTVAVCSAIILYQAPLNGSNAAVALLFLAACQNRGGLAWRLKSGALSLTVALCMAATGNRSYAIAALLFLLNQFIPRFGRKYLVAQVAAISALPLIFDYVASKYSNLFASGSTALTDTRSFLFKEFAADFNFLDVILGRGFTARYFSEYFFSIAKYRSDSTGYNNIWRASSEIGWLNVIMHFGVLALVPFLIVILIASFSRSKMAAYQVRETNLRRFIPIPLLLFSVELWNATSAAYFCWYVSLGAMLSFKALGQTQGAPRQLRTNDAA